MKIKISRVVSFLLVALMLMGLMPLNALAESLTVDYVEKADDYYKVITKDDYQLAPGIVESEIVLNNASGSHRQVAHVVEVDLENEYTKVMPSYKGMVPTPGSYGVQVMSEQAKWAEANGYGNVVAAMNLSLSWYNTTYYTEHPELVGEPLGYMVLDGDVYINSQGQTSGAQTCVVINFDEKDGVARPADVPKVEIRSTSSAITGWEEQVIPANFGFLVKDGVNQYAKDNNAANGASRSFVGIKEDGTFVMVMNDGRQSPYSAGFTNYEMAEFMLSLGCVQAVNGDGGGSSAFLSQRPGEELKINCSPSDGAERPTTHGILVVSTAPATGEFVRANITTDNDYYTPGSSVEFTALGTDLVGTPAEIPADAYWQLADTSMGSIDENGIFTSNGTEGIVTAQLVYNDAVVGEASITIVLPDIAFKNEKIVVGYGNTIVLPIEVTTNEGRNTVSYKADDIVYTLSDNKLGTIVGDEFIACDASVGLTNGTITAVICGQTDKSVTAEIRFGKASEIVYDYEDGQFLIDTDPEVAPAEGEPYGWFIRDTRSNSHFAYRFFAKKTTTPVGLDIPAEVYLVDRNSGMVKNGNYAMGFDIDWTNVTASCHGQVDLFLPESLDMTDATKVGFWMYVPAEMVTDSMQMRVGFRTTSGGSTAVTNNIADLLGTNSGVENGGWFYFSWDVLDTYKSFEYIQINSHYTAGEGNYNYYQDVTYYIDDITVDYSDATIDRENPYFTSLSIADEYTNGAEIVGQTINTNTITLMAQAYENTDKPNATGLNVNSAKLYVDGVLSNADISTTIGGAITVSDLYLNDGVHNIVMEISDNQGNVGNIVRKLVVNTEKSAVRLEVPAPEVDLLPTGSIYWLNLVADDIADIESVSTTINLDYVNDWELEGMEVAYGFEAEYYINNHNDAVITFTRTGTEVADTTILAKLPVRIWEAKGWQDDSGVRADYISNDPAKQDKYYILTPHAMWYSDGTRDYRMVVGAEAGIVTYVDGSTITFAANETVIQTEMNRYYTNSDRQNKWSFHIHTAGEPQSKAATCTTAGYTDRVFCTGCACGSVENIGSQCDTHNGCGSVIDWGTVVPATGHDVSGEDGLNTCGDCGITFYYVDGAPQTGWINSNGKYYYCDSTGAAANGIVTIDGHTYTFVDFVLTDAAWEHDGAGLTAWWAGELIKGGSTYESKWKTINGKNYYFTDIYAATGLVQVKISTDAGYKYYIFGEDGAWLEDYTGLYEGTYEGKTGTYYAKNGICTYEGLVYIDGYYYYINSSFTAVKSKSYYVSRNNDLLPKGEYEFDAEGRMINPPSVEPDTEPSTESTTSPDVKNGVVAEDGKLYYYENNVKVAKGLYKDADGNYYVFGINYYALGEGEYWLNEVKLNGLTGPNGIALKPGFYKIGADCKVIFEAPKNGIVEENGKLYFYENDVKIAKGLYKDANGDYYVFGIKYNALGEGEYWLNEAKLNGLSGPNGNLLQPGFYKIGADCKVIFAEPKNGIVEENGKLYFYENDVKIAKGLYKDTDGKYYVFGVKLYALGEGEYWLNEAKLNGLAGPDGNLLQPGFYKINSECNVVFD